MRSWHKKLVLLVVVVSTLLSSAFAETYGELQSRIATAKPAEVVAAVRESTLLTTDKQLRSLLESKEPIAKRATSLRDWVGTRAWAATVAPKQDGKALAERAKRSRLYIDQAEKAKSNWLENAFKGLQFNFPQPKLNPNSNPFGGLFSGPLLVQIMWGLLALAGIALAWFAVQHIRKIQSRKRVATAILEEDEPERTVDEWLAQADALAAEGRHRESVRCLYLATLLRIDEAGIARFERSETNWEHLSRIEASNKLPSEIEFRTPTKAFDRIWYGFIVRGQADVDEFRAIYQNVLQALRGVKS